MEESINVTSRLDIPNGGLNGSNNIIQNSQQVKNDDNDNATEIIKIIQKLFGIIEITETDENGQQKMLNLDFLQNSFTNEQQDIINCEFSNMLLINALAGTGKTTTLIKFCEARRDKKILYLAYNSATAKEIKQKTEHLKNVKAATMHSIAYHVIGYKYQRRLKNNTMYAYDMLRYCNGIKYEDKDYYASLLLQQIRNFCNTEQTIEKFIENYIIKRAQRFKEENLADPSFFAKKLPLVWQDLIKEDSDLPFEHDFYLKLYQLSNPTLNNYDYILIDEAQDLNGCMLSVILNQPTKKVFVGDTHQSIYQWRGAKNAFIVIGHQEGVTNKYLTQTFRCSESVTNIANQYLSLLGAPKPLLPRKENIDTFTDNSTKTIAIIARTNARLFDFAVNNIKKKLYFVGGINSYKFEDLIDIQNLMFGYRNIKNPFLRHFQDIDELQKYAQNAKEIDLQIRIKIVRDYSDEDIADLIRKIRYSSTNDEKQADYIMTTAHKAKGLEWDKVKLLDDFIDIQKEIKKSEKGKDNTIIEVDRQELNLIYVAITRAREELYANNYILNDIENIKRKIKII